VAIIPQYVSAVYNVLASLGGIEGAHIVAKTEEMVEKEEAEKLNVEDIGEQEEKDTRNKTNEYAEHEEQRRGKFSDMVAKLRNPEYREYPQSLLDFGVMADCVEYEASTLNSLEQWDSTPEYNSLLSTPNHSLSDNPVFRRKRRKR